MGRTRGLIVKKPAPTSPGYSDVFSLDSQIVESTTGTWAFGNQSIYGFIAHGMGTAYNTWPFVIYKKLEDGRFYPQPNPDMMPSYTLGNGIPHLSPNKQLLVAPQVTTGLMVYKYDSTYYTDFKYATAYGSYSSSNIPTVVKFHPSGNYLVVGKTTTTSTNQIEVWSVSSSGVLTYVSGARPSGTTSSRTIKSLEWSPDGTKLLVTHPSSSPGWSLYSFSGGTLTDISPAGGTMGTASAIQARWSGDGNYLSVAANVSPYVRIYSVSGNTLTALTVPTMTSTSGLAVDSTGINFFYTDGVAGAANGLLWLQRTAGTSTLTKLSNVGPLYWTVAGIDDIGLLNDTQLMLMGRFSAVFRVAGTSLVNDVKDLFPQPYGGDYIAQGQPRFTSNTFLEQNSLSPGGLIILTS